jgi:hypothetical protein
MPGESSLVVVVVAGVLTATEALPPDCDCCDTERTGMRA